MPNTGVAGRVVFADTDTDTGIQGVTVAAFDVDRLTEEHLGSAVTGADGRFTISYSPSKYRMWFGDSSDPEAGPNPDIEVRFYGEGQRLLHETPKQSNVQVVTLDVGDIKIHRHNFRVPDTASEAERLADPYWLVTHTTIHPTSGNPIRLTQGNLIDWLVDGADMFPAITDALRKATTSIRFENMSFGVEEPTPDSGLLSKFQFPFPKNHKTVEESDVVTVHRLDRIMAHKADEQNLPVRVLVWELLNDNDTFRNFFDGFDLADEVRDRFEDSNVVTSSLVTTQLLHIKMVVVDGTQAFVVGSTMKQGYFNDEEHLIRDARHGGRTLMHDASVSVRGPAVRDIDQTFTTLWAAGTADVQVLPAPRQDPQPGGAGVQVLRTLPGEVFVTDSPDEDTENLPHGETGILESYQRAIMKAEEFIYIEDQYFTSPEIATAIKLRMAEKPDLEVILVLNVKPDIPGYSKMQAALIKDLRQSLGKNRNRLGVFTIWSTDADQSTFEVAPIYVHAKVAIIDDRWATVGTANKDGASLNYRQWGLIACAVLEELSVRNKVLITLLVPVLAALAAIVSVPLVVLAKTRSVPILNFIIDAIAKETARQAQHAAPSRSRQPPRHPELNVVVYDGIAGQAATGKVKELRERLWREQLGEDPPAAKPAKGWVFHWRLAACNHLQKLRAAAEGIPSDGATTIKILRWIPIDQPEAYLNGLGVNTDFIDVRGGGEELLFNTADAELEP
jgi:phosphatidylserine/phosphatidylglycerophosphate/cardiolipin synthase-like enzyme